MCENWIDPVLAEVTFDDNGMFDDEEIYSILQANVDPTGTFVNDVDTGGVNASF